MPIDVIATYPLKSEDQLEFKQLAVALDADGNDMILALDHRGQAWMYYYQMKPGNNYSGHTEGWKMLCMQKSTDIPPLEKK